MNNHLPSNSLSRRPASNPASTTATLGFVAACCLAGLVALVMALHKHAGENFNTTLLLDIHQHYDPQDGTLAAFASRAFEPGLMAAVALIVAAISWRFAKVWATTLAAVAIGASAITLLLKHAFHEARPHLFAGPIVEKGYSFPSGHTLLSTALLPLLAAGLAPRLHSPAARVAVWTVGLLAPVAIGYDRLYLGVHWPTDVLAGFLGGITCACCGFIALVQAKSR